MALTFTVGGDLVIVLDDENVERIQKADPFELDLRKMGNVTLRMPFKVHICYAPENDPRIMEFLDKNDMDGLLKYLSRGFKLQPGDHDENYKLVGTIKRGGQ